jgi:hypothetical protein
MGRQAWRRAIAFGHQHRGADDSIGEHAQLRWANYGCGIGRSCIVKIALDELLELISGAPARAGSELTCASRRFH